MEWCGQVWFARSMFKVRAQSLCALLHAERPDVICLQEVTSDLLGGYLSKLDWLRAEYMLSDTNGQTVGGYGVVMARRAALGPCLSLDLFPLDSSMGRKLLLLCLEVNCCCHFLLSIPVVDGWLVVGRCVGSEFKWQPSTWNPLPRVNNSEW